MEIHREEAGDELTAIIAAAEEERIPSADSRRGGEDNMLEEMLWAPGAAASMKRILGWSRINSAVNRTRFGYPNQVRTHQIPSH